MRVPAEAILREGIAVEPPAFVAIEEFARQSEVAHDRIAAWRPFVNETRDPQIVVAGEEVAIGVAIVGARMQIGKRRQIRAAVVDVVPGVNESGHGSLTGMRGAGGGIGVAAEYLHPEFQELIGWRQPAHLQSIVAILRIEEGAIRQRRIGERPIVGVPLVEITDPGEEAPRLDGESVGQILGLDIGFFYRQTVVVLHRKIEETHQRGIDVRG